MKILTWNINGIRASSIPLKELFDSLDADVICLQETKVTRDQLDERTAVVEGYNSYYSFSNVRSGYSGVATYVRESATPIKAEQGLTGHHATGTDDAVGCHGDYSAFTEEELRALDNEGRAVMTQHRYKSPSGEEELLTIINVYCPRADPEREDRKVFKLRFYEMLQTRAEAILRAGSHVIVLGDVNTAHHRIDHCDPAPMEDFRSHPGRKWLNQFLVSPRNDKTKPGESQPDTAKDCPSSNSALNDSTSSEDAKGGQFIDTFRYFYPDQKEAYTCWNTSTGAREFNYGVRIDYIFASRCLCEDSGEDCIILPDVHGSDHCPVKLTLQSEWIPSKKCPQLCTKCMPEFAGRQQKLSSFLVKRTDSGISDRQEKTFTSLCEVQKTDLSKSASSEKRSSDLTPAGNVSKKPRLTKTGSGGKQSSLMNFFSKPKKVESDVKRSSIASGVNSGNDVGGATSMKSGASSGNSGNAAADGEAVDMGKLEAKFEAASQWKSLFKGPKPAPLCKGHKEPCTLRLVKKDGLNKGRQFYCCARGEGPKSNLESRCEHFEWVEKKKKS